MRVIQKVLQQPAELAEALAAWHALQPQLLLAFGPVDWLQRLAEPLAAALPHCHRLGCTSAGEISNQGVTDGACVVTALRFDACTLQAASTPLAGMADTLAAGQRLARQLAPAGLRLVWVLGQGVDINGSALIAGMIDVLGPQVLITGGLAADAAAFKKTFVLDDTGVHPNRVACIGFNGQALQVAHGSFGGWEPFGPVRKVTRCQDNVLFELDNEPALDIYKRYLGQHANQLPASGLLFPLAMLGSDSAELGLIRSILAVDVAQGSLTLAGNLDPDGCVRLMHASTEGLVKGAQTAAQAAQLGWPAAGPGVALLVSCVGRKLVMGGRVEEEVEAVASVLRQHTTLAGFYAYGEISPISAGTACKLHNQTMTITTLAECLPSA